MPLSITAATRHQRALPTGAPLVRPNVVLVVTDDQEIGTTGSDVMPYLASNPLGNWVSFPNSHVTTPLCGVSRSTLFTGQRWQRHGVSDNSHTDNLNEATTLAVRLQSAGYRTGLFGKYNNLFPNGHPAYTPQGWDHFWGEIGEFTGSSYYSWLYQTNIPGAQTSGGTTDADFIVDKTAYYTDQFIRSSAGQPFFAMVTPVAPHQDVAWPARHNALDFSTIPDPPDFDQADLTGYPAYMQAQPRMPALRFSRSQSSRKKARKTIRSIDEMMQTIITALTQTGQLDNTVIIYMTDNSNAYGRKRSMSDDANYQKRVPYHYSTGALMKVRYPGATQRVDPALVASVDIPVSILKWAQGTWAHPVDGSDRLANWALGLGGNRPSLEMTFLQYPNNSPIPSWNSLITTTGQRYTEYTVTGERERFDLTVDPYEMTPLYGTNPALESSLSATLAQHMTDPHWWEG